MYAFPCPKEDRVLEEMDNLRLVQLGQDRVDDFTHFVWDVFVRRIGKRQGWEAQQEELEEMLEEERLYAPRGIYFAACRKSDDQIVGAYRMVQWRTNHVFPVEKVFGINITQLALEKRVSPHTIWHASQLAVDKEAIQAAGTSSKKVVFRIFCHSVDAMRVAGANYTIAETDPQVERMLQRHDVKMQPISDFADYIGQTRVSLLDNRLCFESPLFQRFSPLKAAAARKSAA